MAELIAAGEGRRLVSGADGIRPARLGRPQHSRRRPQPRDAVDDEPARSSFASRFARSRPSCCATGRTSISTCRPGRTAPTCCWSRRSAERQRLRQPLRSRPRGLDKLKAVRSTIPAVTHVDYSARVQTVDAERHGRLFRKLLKAFEAKTGCPVMINTSFNVRGEPIVCSPEDAYRCFHGHEHGRAGAGAVRAAQVPEVTYDTRED